MFIDSIKIKRLATTKFLGTYINEHLDWKPHISHVALKMAKSIGIINKVKHFITSPTRRTLYCSLVLPYIQYCNIVWAKTYPTNLDKIMKLQKRVVRIIANAGYRDPTEPLFSKFKLLDVYAINKFQTGSFMYRCFDKSSIFPQHFRNYFILNKDIHSYETRNANRVHINKVRTTTRKQTLKHSGSLFWNSLDKYITEAATLFFQARLRSHIHINIQ